MKVKLRIPTSLSDIKLSQYQKFIKTTEGKEDINFINRQLVGIFCNVPDDIVGKIRKNDFNDVIERITNVLNETPKLVMKTTLNGVKYGFIPKLEDITVDEQADLEMLLRETRTFDKAAAVLYRPITAEKKDKYQIEEYKGKGESLDVTLDCMLGAISFFLTLQKDLLNSTLSYIEAQVESQPKKYKTSGLSGDGIRTITHWLNQMSEGSAKLVS